MRSVARARSHRYLPSDRSRIGWPGQIAPTLTPGVVRRARVSASCTVQGSRMLITQCDIRRVATGRAHETKPSPGVLHRARTLGVAHARSSGAFGTIPPPVRNPMENCARAVFVRVAHEATQPEPGGRHSCLPETRSIRTSRADRNVGPRARSGRLCAIRPKTAVGYRSLDRRFKVCRWPLDALPKAA
jgi:hypothetical protein